MLEKREFQLAMPNQNNVLIYGNKRVTVITDRLLRFEWSSNGVFEDHQTLAVINRDNGKVAFKKNENNESITIDTGKTVIRIKKDDCKFDSGNLEASFMLNGKEVLWHYGDDDNGNLKGTTRTLDQCDGDHFFMEANAAAPFADKFGPNRDYKIDLGKGFLSRSGWSVIDDSSNVILIPADNDNGKWVAARSKAERQDFYLLAYGHEYRDALRDASSVFGSQPLAPRYAFGYWYSRYWAYSDSDFEKIVGGFDRSDTPIDVMVVDMDWHLDGWTGYTWDKRFFSDPDRFLKLMHRKGLHVTLNLHPADGVGKHEEQFADMCRAIQLDPEKTERIPFDITDQKFVKPYFEVLHHPEEKRGVDFWWMDWQQGKETAIEGLDPLAWLNAQHWYDMQKRQDNTRPLIFSRFGGIGAGRYCVGFSGDTYSTWESLAYQPYFTANAANVLYGYWSHDLGGHIPGIIEPELYVRWMQYGVFSPVMRTHTTKNLDADREFWVYPSPYSEYLRDAIIKRYELVPYIYTECRKTVDSGVSLCYPLYYDNPEEERSYEQNEVFKFGENMLISPVVAPADKDTLLSRKSTWLPSGEFFDTVRGSLVQGNSVVTDSYMLDEIPIFVKAGSIIPGQSGVRRLNYLCCKNLNATVYPGAAGSYRLYEDDGKSNGYINDRCAWINMEHSKSGRTRRFEIKLDSGSYDGFEKERNFELRLAGVIPPQSVKVNGIDAEWCYDFEETDAPAAWRYDGNNADLVVKCGTIDLVSGCEVLVTYAADDEFTPASGLRGAFARLREIANINNTMISRWPKCEERLGQDLGATGRRIALKPETFDSEISRTRKLLPEFFPMINVLIPEKIKGDNDRKRVSNIERAKVLAKEVFKN